MSSLQLLRDFVTERLNVAGEEIFEACEEEATEFVSERLTAAAEEILGVLEKTVAEFQEEIVRLRRLVDVVFNPEIKLRRAQLPQRNVCKEEEVLTDQQLCSQGRNSSVDLEDPERPQIKEELCSSPDVEELAVKQETETFMLTPVYEESDQQLLSGLSPVSESQDQEGSKHVDSDSTRNAEPELKMRCYRNTGHSNYTEISRMSGSHYITHTGKKSFTCDTCGKTFEYKSRFESHMRTHTGEEPYVCNTCGKRFSWMSGLNVHLRIHTGERPYCCDTCGKRFRKTAALNTHLKIHTGEKPFACNVCEKRFIDSSKLERHMVIHTGEKPHLCNTCGTRFSDKSVLKRHIRIHTGEKPYFCKICEKTFSHVSSLNAHVSIHTGEKPHLCKVCGKAFRRNSYLKVHMRNHSEKPFSRKPV